MPDVNARPTGAVLDAGEVFEVSDWVKPSVPGQQGYLQVAGKAGWAFNVGVAGDWLAKPIIERLPDGEIPKPEAEVKREREQEEEKAAAEAERDLYPQDASEMDVLKLLSWGRAKPGMKVHPGISVKGSHLVTSLPIAEGTPLVGLVPELTLKDPADGADIANDEFRGLIEAAGGDEQWSLRLGLLLLRERRDALSSWQTYVRSLPPRPAAPLLWGQAMVAELQDKATRQAVREEADRLADFANTHLAATRLAAASADPVFELQRATAAAKERAVLLGGRHQLIPLVDLVGPPEGPAAEDVAAGRAVPPATCKLSAEGEGEDLLYVLYAARDLQPGTTLTRDVGLSNDELLLVHGLVGRTRQGDRIALTGCVLEGIPDWQAKALQGALQTRPGRFQGDLEFSGELQRCEELSEAVSESFLHAARVLTCANEDELDVYAGDPGRASETAGESRGLAGLFGDRRNVVIDKLIQLIKTCRGEFATSLEEDTKSLESAEGSRRIATAFRREKKRVIEDVLEMLEREKGTPQEASLPFAVTGRRP